MVGHARRRRIVRLVLLSLAALWSLAAAQDPDLDSLRNWEAFLTWLTEPSGVTLGAGVILSVLFEYVPRYDQLSKKLKRVVFAGACVFVPVAAAVLGMLTLGWTPSWIQTFWPAIVTGVFVFGTGTMAHTPRIRESPEPAPAMPSPPDQDRVLIKLEAADVQTAEQAARTLANVLAEMGVEVDLSRLDGLLAEGLPPDGRSSGSELGETRA